MVSFKVWWILRQAKMAYDIITLKFACVHRLDQESLSPIPPLKSCSSEREKGKGMKVSTIRLDY
jgi:hypothetical protein